MAAQGPRDAEWWSKYSAYLLTPEWKMKRTRFLKRAGGICEGCGLNPAKQVHHLNYEHVFNEFLFELVEACDDCHERIQHKEEDKIVLPVDIREWEESFPCEACRWQDEEDHIRWCGKFHVYARVALAENGDCGPHHKEREPLK